MAADRQASPRERISQALIDVVLERGYDGATVEEVLDRAGLDRASFDRCFSSKEDCFAQTFATQVVEPLEERVFAAFARHESWRDALRAAAYEAARFMRDNPRESRFGAIEMSEVGPAVQAQRERQLRHSVDLIDAGRQELDDPDSMTRAVAERTLAALYAVALREVGEGTGGSFESLVPELMYLAVRPYLGEEVAGEELTIPAPEESARSLPGQRERIRSALIDLVLERGVEHTTVAMVVDRAGLDREAFDHQFASLEDCVLDAYLVFSGEFGRQVFGSYEAAGSWRDGLRAAGYATARYVREQPREIRFGTIALLSAGPALQEHRVSHLQRLADLIDRGREQLEDPDSMGPEVAMGMLARIREEVVEALRSGDPRKAPEEYVPELMALTIRPYLGEEAANEELTMAPPAGARPVAGERERIGEAMVDLVLERGYEATTIELVLERAGVGRAAFDRLFDGKEHLYLEIFWEAQAVFDEGVAAAFQSQQTWRDALRAAAYTAARYIRDHPRVVRFGVIQMFAAGDLAQVYRERQLHGMVDLIDAGRQELDDPDSMTRGVAEGVLGSIYGVLVKELQSGAGVREAESHVPELMYMAVRPYLGHEVAREELTIPPPPEPPPPEQEALRRSSTQLRQPVHEAAAPSYGQGVSKVSRQGDEAALRLARLPPGRHGLPREFVTQNQRDRLAAGTIAVVAEHGFNAATITQICAAAGVSRRTFYAYFSSKEECFFAAYATIAEHLRMATDAAAAEQVEWTGQVVAKLGASLEFLAANPDLARFCLIAPQRAGEKVAARYRKAMDRAVDYFCEGMPPPPATRAPSEAIAGSLVGGMVALVVRKVEGGEGDELPTLLPDLVELFLTPYLGRTEAVRVAQEPL